MGFTPENAPDWMKRQKTESDAYAARMKESYKRQKRNQAIQGHPLMRLAADFAAAIGQPEREGQLHISLELIQSELYVWPHDRVVWVCWNEVNEALSKTDAPLSEVREFVNKAKDNFGDPRIVRRDS